MDETTNPPPPDKPTTPESPKEPTPERGGFSSPDSNQPVSNPSDSKEPSHPMDASPRIPNKADESITPPQSLDPPSSSFSDIPVGPPLPPKDLPSGQSRDPDKPRTPRLSIKTALIVVAVVMITGAAIAALLARKADKISLAYDKSQSVNQGLAQENQKLQEQIISLHTEEGSWEQKYQKLMVDRNNLLTQAKRLMNEQSESSASSELYEKVVISAIEDNWELKAYLTPLEEKLETLQAVHDDLLAERLRLENENVYLQERADQEQFEDKINEIESKRNEVEQALLNANREIKELKSVKRKAEKSFDKIEGRFENLQEKYTKLLAENKEMRFRDKHLPRDVTIMAKEHERLIRNLADTHYNMGVLFTEKDDFVRAVKEFKKVMELRPNDTDALYNLGLIYAEHLPDRTRSREYFNRYLQISPDSHDASWVRQYIASWRAWDAKELLE